MATSRRRKHIRIGLAVFWLSAVAWLLLNMQARGIDPAVLQSDDSVHVSVTATTLAFTPAIDTARVGLLFYPGALADPKAYAPMARAVAEAGYEVIVIELPFRTAPLKRHREQVVQRTRAFTLSEGGRRWMIGGHSKGGALAAQFARDDTLGADRRSKPRSVRVVRVATGGWSRPGYTKRAAGRDSPSHPRTASEGRPALHRNRLSRPRIRIT